MFIPDVRDNSQTLRRINARSAAWWASFPNTMVQSTSKDRIHIVVVAMHIQRVFGQRVRGHFYHHRRKLARGVVVLLARYTMPWPEVKFTTRRPVTARAVDTFGMCWR